MRRLNEPLVPQHPLYDPLVGWPTCAGTATLKPAISAKPSKPNRLMSAAAPMRDWTPDWEYSTASARHSDDITDGARNFRHCRCDGGISGTDRARRSRLRAVLTSSPVIERRRARASELGGAAARSSWGASLRGPLTPRHALRHLTTLGPRRCVELGSQCWRWGESRSSVPTSIGRRRRITRTRLGAMAEDPRDSGEGMLIPSGLAGGACVR
jgi:hypothetical protein